jgi:hypothetical protein
LTRGRRQDSNINDNIGGKGLRADATFGVHDCSPAVHCGLAKDFKDGLAIVKYYNVLSSPEERSQFSTITHNVKILDETVGS